MSRVSSLKLLGGKLAPKMIHFEMRKELLDFSETHPECLLPCMSHIVKDNVLGLNGIG